MLFQYFYFVRQGERKMMKLPSPERTLTEEFALYCPAPPEKDPTLPDKMSFHNPQDSLEIAHTASFLFGLFTFFFFLWTVCTWSFFPLWAKCYLLASTFFFFSLTVDATRYWLMKQVKWIYRRSVSESVVFTIIMILMTTLVTFYAGAVFCRTCLFRVNESWSCHLFCSWLPTPYR